MLIFLDRYFYQEKVALLTRLVTHKALVLVVKRKNVRMPSIQRLRRHPGPYPVALVLGFTILFVCVFGSCSTPKELVYEDFRNFTIQHLGFNSSTVSMDIIYYNPNNFGMQLRNSDLDIFINGNLLGHSSQDTLLRIPRRDTFSFPVRFDVQMDNMLKNAWATLTGKEVTVKLTGKVRIGKANVFMVFPVNYETRETFSLF